MTTPTPSGLVYNGLPVPWIVRWSAEVDPSPIRRIDGKLSYPDGNEHRELNVLWMREHNDRQGQGTPVFGDMSTTRQREALLGRLCQVCGNACVVGQAPVQWLRPMIETKLSKPRGGRFTTTTPPVCAVCWPIALANCPNLKAHAPEAFTVWDYRVWGFYGEIADDRGHRLAELPRGSQSLDCMLARQLVVEVYHYRTREV